MIRLSLSALLIVTLGLPFSGCVQPSPDGPHTAAAPRPAFKPVTDDGEAVESANAFLRQHGYDWGRPTQIQRTVSQWYRIDYARDSSGHERVVLVNPATGQPEFPLPR